MNLVNVDDREWNMNQMSFTDDIALVANSEERLGQVVEEFKRVYKIRKLKVNDVQFPW